MYLRDADVTYRLATADRKLVERLDTYYAQISSLYHERSKGFTAYWLTYAAAVLATFNGIREATAGGITVPLEYLKHITLILWPLAQFRLGTVEAKFSFIANLFRKYLSGLDAEQKVDFLARYPLAFGFDEYYIEKIGNLPYLIRMNYPIRLTILIIFILLGVIGYIAFSIWVYFRLALDVIRIEGVVPEFWSWCVVIASASIMLFTYALPASNIFRKRYTHMGLVHRLNSLFNRDRDRYAEISVRIDHARRNMKLKVDD